MLKKTVLLLPLLVFCFGIPQKLHKIDTVKINHVNQLVEKEFYAATDAKELLYYIKNSDKKYKLVFTFTNWCKPCREMHPHILFLQKEFRNAEFFYLTDIYNQRNYPETISYLKTLENSSPIFTIWDNEKNKNAKGKYEYFVYNPQKKKKVKDDRYIYFTQQLFPGHWYYGYSLVIVYDESNKPVYASTYKETDEEILRKVKAILSN